MGSLCRWHSGTFDGFEVAPACLEFLEWATRDFGADGSRPDADKVGRTDHVGHFISLVRPSTTPPERCLT
jgi:hypothetical protein